MASADNCNAASRIDERVDEVTDVSGDAPGASGASVLASRMYNQNPHKIGLSSFSRKTHGASSRILLQRNDLGRITPLGGLARVLNAWFQSKRLAVQERIALLHKLRLRALAVVVGLILAAVGVVSVVSAPAWPIVAGAVAIAAVAVNSVASRLTKTICIGCGQSLAESPVGQYGAVCPSCGTISTPAGTALAADTAESTELLDADSEPIEA
ncbi:MAG: hypothetical protein AAGH71_07985 [Planctomycetota bacterium]